ncbi:hypothetical protein MPH_08970 [Macrophomina phaseolina MS6]|uniref:Uncharacterized protein n=1 Tax=Macrophomina phaseolina (strain MS6) TaxID=1126212 RepID=K2RM36_MACPH|nr:hypothetical protein MPH_08970 [Macrophomina phaseolina MS6]
MFSDNDTAPQNSKGKHRARRHQKERQDKLRKASPYTHANDNEDTDMFENGFASNASEGDDDGSGRESEDDDLEEEERSRKELLAQGSKAALENLDEVTLAPPEILTIYEQCYRVTRSWWEQNLTEGHKKGMENLNSQIRRITAKKYPEVPETTYEYPWRELQGHIHAFKKLWQQFLDEKDESKKERLFDEIDQNCGLYALKMEKRGIPYKMIVTKEVVEALAKNYGTGKGEKSRKAFTKATPNQLAVLRPAEEIIPKLIAHAKSGDAKKLEKDILEIESLNKALSKTNSGSGLRQDDHLLPLEDFRSIHKVVISEEDDEDDKSAAIIKLLGKISAKLLIGGLPVQWMAGTQSKMAERGQQAYTSQLLRYYPDDKNSRGDYGSITGYNSDISAPRRVKENNTSLRSRGKRSDTVTPKPKFSAFFGPELMEAGITPYGKIVHIRKAGRGLYRACVNAGTNELPYYFMRPSSDFPKGVLEKLYPKFGYLNELPAETTSWDIMYATCVMTGEAPASGKRAAPQWLTVRTLQEPDVDYITTMSGLGSIRGQSQARKLRDGALRYMEEIKETLAYYKRENLHPETEQTLSESDRSEVPWLFLDAPDPGAKNQQHVVWSPPTLRRRHPELLVNKEEDQETEEEDDYVERPARRKIAATNAVKQIVDAANISEKELLQALRRLK